MSKARDWSDEEKQWMTDNLSYVPENGDLVWKDGASSINNKSRVAGSVAGTVNTQGYLVISMWSKGNYLLYRAHRIVWFLNYGEVPSLLDHINRNKLDNRVENLRPTTHSLNGRNTNKRVRVTSKYKGVYYNKINKSYTSSIRANNKMTHIGTSKSEKELAEMYDKWIEENLSPLEREYAKTNKELGLL
tara:strand:- start:54 stop:620 length:567 start_codon:yes stop_codon:yes gene_type:complete